MADSGEEVEALETRPALDPDLGFILGKFFLVSRSRPQSMGGVAPVQLSDIETVYRMYDLSELLPIGEFVDYCMVLDNELLAFYREREKRKELADG